MKKKANGFFLSETLLSLLCLSVCIFMISLFVQCLRHPASLWKELEAPLPEQTEPEESPSHGENQPDPPQPEPDLPWNPSFPQPGAPEDDVIVDWEISWEDLF